MILRKLFLSGSVAFATLWMSACSDSDDKAASPGTGGQDGTPPAGSGGGDTDPSDGLPSGGSENGSENGSDASFPSDGSESGIAAFLADGTYRDAPWEEVAHVPDESYGHGDVRVFLNDVLLASAAAGNGEAIASQGGTAHDTGSMAVKELLDDGEIVGLAVMLKHDDGFGDWAYYCEGSGERCQSGQSTAEHTAEDPFFATDSLNACAICHGGLVFTTMPR